MPHGLRSSGRITRTGAVLTLALFPLLSHAGSDRLDVDPSAGTQTIDVPPPAPINPIPAYGEIGQMPLLDLRWGTAAGPGLVNWEIHFGTTTPPPTVATIPPINETYQKYHVEGLTLNTTYYWSVVALGENGSNTAGPVWSFRTGTGGLPPGTPGSNYPQVGVTGAPLKPQFQWRTFDPEMEAMDYDIYLGTDPDPALYMSHFPAQGRDTFGLLTLAGPLHSLTMYYWRIVARDPGGNETSGPVWWFTTGVNHAPLVPDAPIPPDNATGFSSSTINLKWRGGDPDYQSLEYDVYFGTDPSPPLVATHVPSVPYIDYYWQTSITGYAAGPFTNGMTYYWKIVAHDPEGAVTEGPVWSFSVDENQAPVFDTAITPIEGATTPVIQKLSWSASDANLDPLIYDLYLGTTDPPPLYRIDLTTNSYTPLVWDSPLLTGSTYYWYVVCDDGTVQTTSPTHTFTTVPPGDVNLDGEINSADVTCLMNIVIFLGVTCAGNEGRARADVNCDGFVSPADARALHKNVVDGSPICSGGTTPAPRPPLPPQSAQARSNPVVDIMNAWIEWDTLKVSLGVSGVPSLKSLGIGFEVSPHKPYYAPWTLVVKRTGATQQFEPFAQSGYNYTTWDDRLIAGYTLGDVDCTSETELIELDIYLPDRTFDYVKLSHFVDDLAGAPDVTVLSENVPVLFSVFTATPRAGGIDVSWKLQSDEAMESYTLYRHDDDESLARVIANGSVTGTTGSYFDRDVRPGTTYHYELAIRTADGDMFRSPIADASMAPMKLALYQNRPNPFNPRTTIRYDLPPGNTRVRLRVLDVGGHVVRTLIDENQTGGTHSVVWSGNDDRGGRVSSGVYFYVLDTGGKRLTKKLVLLK